MSASLGEWAEHAACAGTPQTWWFPTRPNGLDDPDTVPAEAAALCAACTVRDDCHRHALLHEMDGVWAATSERGRAQLRRAAGIRLRLDEDIVRQERARLLAQDGTPPRTISAELGVTRRSVHRYLTGEIGATRWWERADG